MFFVSGVQISNGAKEYRYAESDQELAQAEAHYAYSADTNEQTVADAIKELESRGYTYDQSFAILMKEIESFKKEKREQDPKKIVRYFNAKAGLKQKPENRKISVRLAPLAQAISYADWSRLTTGEKIMIASNPVAGLKTNALGNTAYIYTQQKFGTNGLGDRSDGYRHAIWNALMTRDINRAWADGYATAHEDKTWAELNTRDTDGYFKYQHRTMDLNNNRVGRDVIAWYEFFFNCSDATVQNRISAKLINTSGNIIWLHN